MFVLVLVSMLHLVQVLVWALHRKWGLVLVLVSMVALIVEMVAVTAMLVAGQAEVEPNWQSRLSWGTHSFSVWKVNTRQVQHQAMH